MKRLGVLLTLAAMSTIALPVHAADTWALIVGISKYQNSQIPGLRFAAADAAAFLHALTDPKRCDICKDHVLLLTDDNATASAITGSIDTFLKPHVKEGDTIIIYIACHGVTKGLINPPRAYLLPTDVNGLTTTALDESAVNLREFTNRLADLPASSFIV